MHIAVMLAVRLSEVLRRILEIAREVELANGTEEDLKVRVEEELKEHVWSNLGIPSPRYEYRVDVGT